MKRTQDNAGMLALGLGAIVSAIGLAACTPQEDGQTAGQKLDRAIASADRKTDEATNDVRAAGRDVGRATAEGLDKAGDAVRDAAITTEINAKLAMDQRLSAIRIDVDTVGGRVVLRGTAPDPQARDHATAIAMAVEGVRGVDNQLVVSGKT